MINNMESGFDAPYNVFNFLANYLDINSGALLFFDAEREAYFHVASKNLDYTSISRLIIQKNDSSELCQKSIRNYISFSDYKNTNTFYKIYFSHNNEKAMLIITNSRVNNNSSYKIIIENKAILAEKIFSYKLATQLKSIKYKKSEVKLNEFLSFIEKTEEETFLLLNVDFSEISYSISGAYYEIESEIFINLIQLFLESLISVLRIGYGNFIFALNLPIDVSEQQIQVHTIGFLKEFINDTNTTKVRALRFIDKILETKTIYNSFFSEE
ncbi:MAG: hypothetical protein JXR63_08580 [Spirochaetales bacterium]|nr:hypothetical protein [Spirochaetales bacterium]